MLPKDYDERVYAGVLGKIIGVYLGRPFEGWTHERILTELGEITYYVHEKMGMPLVVTDDDISGTFTFIRAFQDFNYSPSLTPEQIGQTWLNYLIENRTVLWWGGLGNSTEHTAFIRLKNGIPAPLSGSMKMNGKTVAEQIGAQIFIDGWGMVFPGDPEKAADFARRAASVSHDGEAIYGAQVIASMEALAFVESDLTRLLDCATSFIPKDSLINRLVNDIREWHGGEQDWRKTRRKIESIYGYDRYGGNCHIIPNHALIHLGLLYGEGNFQKSLMITNTSGWDTDCNSANVGCIVGIWKGLDEINRDADWRGPVADRIYLPTADGGRAISDAVTEAFHIANTGRVISGRDEANPKNRAKFHFSLPGAVQGFGCISNHSVNILNVVGHSEEGERSLLIRFSNSSEEQPVRVSTPTFIPPKDLNMEGYGVMASPTLYPGQTIEARVGAAESNEHTISCRLFIRAYGIDDHLETLFGPSVKLEPGNSSNLTWSLRNLYQLSGKPIADVGIEINAEYSGAGEIYLDYLTWSGTPMVVWKRPNHHGSAWKRSWINGVDQFLTDQEPFRLIQNEGIGLLIQGCREWTDYQVNADVVPHMAKSAGIAARVQGMKRYYALTLGSDGKIKLIKMMDYPKILAEKEIGWKFGVGANLSLRVVGDHLLAMRDGFVIFDIQDKEQPLISGAVALLVEEGRMASEGVSLFPVD